MRTRTAEEIRNVADGGDLPEEDSDEDAGYQFAESVDDPEAATPPTSPSPSNVQLSPKQLNAVQRMIWATRVTTSKRHPNKGRRKKKR